MLLVQYLNGLYRSNSAAAFFPMFFNLVIPGVGVYLFVKSLMKQQGDTPINMGKALFLSLMMSLIMAGTNIAAYQHIYNNKKEIIQDWRSLQYAAIDKSVDGDESVLVADKAKRKSTLKENFEVDLKIDGLNKIQTQTMHNKVKGLIAEAREAKTFGSEYPSYMKLVFVEQALRDH